VPSIAGPESNRIQITENRGIVNLPKKRSAAADIKEGKCQHGHFREIIIVRRLPQAVLRGG
jgi:hypothetical protein